MVLRKKFIGLVGMFMVMMMFVGCANNRPMIVASYQALGDSLTATGIAAKYLCKVGKISQNDCEELKNIYNHARDVYISAGDVYVKVIETGADESKTKYTAQTDVVIEAIKQIKDIILKNVNANDNNR